MALAQTSGREHASVASLAAPAFARRARATRVRSRRRSPTAAPMNVSPVADRCGDRPGYRQARAASARSSRARRTRRGARGFSPGISCCIVVSQSTPKTSIPTPARERRDDHDRERRRPGEREQREREREHGEGRGPEDPCAGASASITTPVSTRPTVVAASDGARTPRRRRGTRSRPLARGRRSPRCRPR